MQRPASQLLVGFSTFAAMLAACSGSGGGQEVATKISFAESTTRTAFASGSISFKVQSPPAGVQATCTIDGITVSPCMTSEVGGEIHFDDLSIGRHEVAVSFAAGTDPAVRAVHALEIVRPAVLVFGATPGGIMAAIGAAGTGTPVVIIEPTAWVGGMMSGGLAKTDIGPRGSEIVGGLTARFFERIRAAERGRNACDGSCSDLYDFEPQVAEHVLEQMLEEGKVMVERGVRLEAVQLNDHAIDSIQTSKGRVEADVFIDASYEGDLMAGAGVSHVTGREARVVANNAQDLGLQEDHAGVLRYRPPLGMRVDPFLIAGDPSSGTIAYVEPPPAAFASEGSADVSVMAYTYRLCVTDDPTNRIPFEPPPGYDPREYEAHRRLAQAQTAAGADLAAALFNPARTVRSRNHVNYKYDLNGGSTFSTDMTAPGMNQSYVTADESGRVRIREAYRHYIAGLLYTWQTDPAFGALNQKVARFGRCADEFMDRDGWPHQLYVRVARRMLGEYVMNENDLLQNGRRLPVADVVGFGVYDIDMHTHRYMAAPMDWPDGTRRHALAIEGFQIVRLPEDRPYPVPYRAMTPRADEVTNLLNPVTLSATYVAYSSLRMEPVFMMLGEAAGRAAALAHERNIPVQAVPYAELRARLDLRFPSD